MVIVAPSHGGRREFVEFELGCGGVHVHSFNVIANEGQAQANLGRLPHYFLLITVYIWSRMHFFSPACTSFLPSKFMHRFQIFILSRESCFELNYSPDHCISKE